MLTDASTFSKTQVITSKNTNAHTTLYLEGLGGPLGVGGLGFEFGEDRLHRGVLLAEAATT